MLTTEAVAAHLLVRLVALTRVGVSVLGVLLFAVPLSVSAKPTWERVSAEELQETAPQLEPTAPAEVIFSRLDLDDTDFPQERRTTQYIRFKIFVPDQAEALTRALLVQSSASSRETELVARLVLPNGKTQEFGRESMKERTLVKRGGEPGLLDWLLGGAPELREKFLAISGVERGAVLDYQIVSTTRDPDFVATIRPQAPFIPIRRFEFTCHPGRDGRWRNRTYAFNLQGAHLQHDTTRKLITLTALNLPTLHEEPFLGAPTDYALTIISCNESTSRTVPLRNGSSSNPIAVEENLGAWEAHATFLDWFSGDRARPTARVKQLAAEITAGANDDEAKARAIHRYITIMSQKYRRRPGPHPKATEAADSLDEVLDLETKPTVLRPPEEFLWLAIALYRSAGLECHAVMLPDRSQVRFDPKEIGRVFLPDRAAAVRLGGNWKFSCPQNSFALPFGLLPWENEGQVALLGIERTAQFIPVPPSAADASLVTTTGEFTLSDDGTLSGECRRTFTGHTAVALRGRLRSANNKEKRTAVVRDALDLDLRAVSVTVGKISGIEDAEQPLQIACALRWPGFATHTRDRLIVRSAVLQADHPTPFPATERRYPVQFPFQWSKIDRLTIRLPAGFEPESSSAPAPLPLPDLTYNMKLSYDRAQQVLHVEREFASKLLGVAPADYITLKTCYDYIAQSDQHEVVFRRRAPADPALPVGN